jgi:hypothetical protein
MAIWCESKLVSIFRARRDLRAELLLLRQDLGRRLGKNRLSFQEWTPATRRRKRETRYGDAVNGSPGLRPAVRHGYAAEATRNAAGG